MSNDKSELKQILSPKYAEKCEDAMATEKLAEGIRGFIADLIKLDDMIKDRLV